ncbi:superinfection immunity protein [Bradyrhizobium iriomotense]|uniref:Superinfection immunity protein n=1 Tax=Bradyrhizobium iriomotense TaxID=441950 RepID=A0ABQ6B8P2_9BRAD|nr:superinfection immunity protein [Bradyrhizobium iriomotense]GLR88457.1 hypothetical protein GCM10007857_51690 [Bradyrhizobium iriomotense]
MRLKHYLFALATMALTASPAIAASDGGNAAMGLMLIIVMIACYFFPTIIAVFRGHHNTLAIFLLNLLLGWTFIGWVGALVWAATAVQNINRLRDGY